ncbi:MAG: hypothetical protein RBG13Loki_0728 [Promethearchaeota archaeon CR_4]|nr:MAG: hypothetical protein RBG13Loki_0728 [Candidatus Lokiarchaeota archaeon CR_4]
MARSSSRLKMWTSSQFLGRQLSRLKMGQSYYAIIVSTVNAISLISLAYHVEFWVLVAFFPCLILATLWIGYYLDVHNITAEDSLKSIEMSNRFLNTGDVKAQEFQLLQTEILLEALQSIQSNHTLDLNLLRQKYEAYVKKWKSPDA